MRRPRILVMDSGIGGLGIAAAIRANVPTAALAFVADYGFFPYGEKSDAMLVARLETLFDGLVARIRPDIAVIACNTASTIALAPLRARFPSLPFVGCVPPVKWAAEISRTRVIGLLATGATVRRDYVRDLEARFASDCRLVSHGARGLAALAERRFRGERLPPDAVAREIDPLFDGADGSRIDAVCLGCTHFGLLLPELRDAAPRPLAWLDPADAVARRTATLLQDRPDVEGRGGDGAFVTAWPPNRDGFLQGLRAHGFDGAAVLELAPPV